MSLVRAHLPSNLRNTNALKALAVSLLRNYISNRLTHWSSPVGWVSSYLRNAAHKLSFRYLGTDENPDDIIDDCCELKRKIVDAENYKDYINIIKDILEKLKTAKKSESVSELRRIPLYFAIINTIQQIIKIDPALAQTYCEHVGKYKNNIKTAKAEYESGFNSSKHCELNKAAINNNLFKLIIILGDSTSTFDAISMNYNPLPDLLKPEPHATGSAYLTETSHTEFWNMLETQLEKEQSLKMTRETFGKFESPNFNLPLYLQNDFLMHYCDKVLGLGLGNATIKALDTYGKEFRFSFRKIFNLPERAVKDTAITNITSAEANLKNDNKFATNLGDVPKILGSESQGKNTPQDDSKDDDKREENESNADHHSSPIIDKQNTHTPDDEVNTFSESDLDIAQDNDLIAASMTTANDENQNNMTPGKPSQSGIFSNSNDGSNTPTRLSRGQKKKLKEKEKKANKIANESGEHSEEAPNLGMSPS